MQKTIIGKKIIRRAGPFAIMLILLTVLSLSLIQYFIRHSSQEILNSWLETEAVQIQEGNFLASLSRFSRTLLSSRIVTSVVLFSESNGNLDILVNYGETFDAANLCKRPHIESISSCTVGLFHEVVLYRPALSNQNLLLAFGSKPRVAHAVFWSIVFIMSLIVACFMWVLAFALKKESDERLFLVKTAIEDLIRDARPSEVLVRDFPTIIEMWQEIQSIITNLKEDIEKSSRLSAIARISQQIGHDFRHPLGVFEAMLSASDEELPKMRRSVGEALNRLNAMVESLRYSDKEQTVTPVLTNLDVGFILESHTQKASSRKLKVSLSQSKISSVVIDLAKVERSISNLVSNAIEAAQTSVMVELEIAKEALVIRVKDDGLGIPDEIVPRLYHRGATYGKTDGTGLGLAYVKQIMQGHGGDVTYRRENGLTIFECKLPNVIVEEDGTIANGAQLWRKPKDAIIKVIAICIHPNSLSIDLVEELKSKGSAKFKFSTEYSQESTDIVVLNNRETLLQIFDSDDDVEVIEYPSDLSPEALKMRILEAFHEQSKLIFFSFRIECRS